MQEGVGGGSGNENPKGETSSKVFCIVKSAKNWLIYFMTFIVNIVMLRVKCSGNKPDEPPKLLIERARYNLKGIMET